MKTRIRLIGIAAACVLAGVWLLNFGLQYSALLITLRCPLPPGPLFSEFSKPRRARKRESVAAAAAALDDLIADPQRRAYAAQITAMDDEIGRVVAALEGGTFDTPWGKTVIRKGDHQAMGKIFIGQSKPDPNYPYWVLGDLKMIPAEEVSLDVSQTGCRMP